MREVVRTTNPTLISYITVLLSEQNIEAYVMDTNASILEGSIGILPRRVMVREEHLARARQILTEAGLAHELEKEKKSGF